MSPVGPTRREFLTSTGSLVTLSGVGAATGSTTQERDSEKTDPDYLIERSWNIDHAQEAASLGSIRDDHLYVSFQSFNSGGKDSKSKVARINRFTGDTEWSKKIDDYVYGPSEAGGRVYMAGASTVQCWDGTTGKEIWEKSLSNDIITLAEAHQDRIYVTGFNVARANRNGKFVHEISEAALYVFSAEEGKVEWTNRSDYSLWMQSRTKDRVFVRESDSYFTNDDLINDAGRLVGLNSADGSVEWTSESINPKFTSEQDGVLLVLTEDDDIYTFESDGRRRWRKADIGSDYFVTDEFVIVSRLNRGISIFDHNGIEQTSEPLYTGEDITAIRSDPGADPLFLGIDDGIIAIDGTDFSEQWRTSLPSPPGSIAAREDVIFLTSAGNKLAALNPRSGDHVWEEQVSSTESVSIDVRDEFLYISGSGVPLRAYSGRRGRALTALERESRAEGSVSGMISGLLGWRKYISQAETAVDEGRYEKAHELLNQGRRRRQAIQGVVGVAGASTMYGTSRAGGSQLQLRRLESATERLEIIYPITDGKLKGTEPTDLVAQANIAQKSVEGFWGPKLRTVFSSDYRSLLSKLKKVADYYPELVEASLTLSEIERSYLPDSWVSDLRRAVKAGDADQIEALLDRISNAERLFDQLYSLDETVTGSSLTVSTDHFTDLVESELTEEKEGHKEVDLASLFRTLKDGIDAYESYRGSLGIFNLDPMAAALEQALRNPGEITSQQLQEFRQYEPLFENATRVEQRLSKVEFEAVDASQAGYKQRAQSLFANQNHDGLQDLVAELKNLQEGRWSHSDLFAASPIEFEHLVAALFADMGYEVFVTEAQADKGIDVIARNAQEVLAIQVKQYSRGNTIGRPTVQQIIGAMAQAGADQAIIVTSAGFTQTAIQASRELSNMIELIDGKQLVQLLTKSSLHPSGDASYYRSRASSTGQGNSSWSGSATRNNESRTMGEREAYSVLGIEPPVTQEEIKSQYRQKVKEVHPDAGGSAEMFKKVQDAYRSLSDE